MKRIMVLLMIAVMFSSFCACKKEERPDVSDSFVISDTFDTADSEKANREFYKSVVATNGVETPYGTLEYPVTWKDNVKVVTSEENGIYRVAFNALFGEVGVPLYAIVFGTNENGYLLGELTCDGECVSVYCEDYTHSNIDHLTSEQQQKYSLMCGDINVIISHLVYDCGMITA